ncbi:9524_t:CDS:2 [Paraglomus brasilianum]|uniref:9524_t:CDS:1 n=1 Tax=Paraglomus brasilianum TaxID=144538 RepID=A0A9N8WK13_9GLOM|nr:9524_t:CDS:2 [Paraglomus brasilianum]
MNGISLTTTNNATNSFTDNIADEAPLSVVSELSSTDLTTLVSSNSRVSLSTPAITHHLLRIDSSAFLFQYPRGAYTTARTVKRISVVDFQTHINRLANSISHINYKSFDCSSVIEESSNAVAVDAADCADCEDCGEPEEVRNALKPFRNAATLKRLLLPVVREGLRKYYEIEEENTWHVKGVSEARITVLISYSFEKRQPILATHVSPLRAPQSGKCRVEVHGEPRKAAETKDSQWVRDRRSLEASLRPGFNELLLYDSNTKNIYEGLSSNFFAVLHNPDTQRSVVVTAPKHCVLEGTILRIVETICERDGIEFRFWFPNVADVEMWTGAFITSTSRLILPVEMIRFRDGRPPVKLPTHDETIAHIREEVHKEIFKRAHRIL